MRTLGQGLFGVAVIAAAFAAAGAAHAEKGDERFKASGGGAAAVGGGASLGGEGGPSAREPGAERREGPESTETTDTTFMLGADLAIGFGKTAVVNQDIPGPNGITPATSISGAPLSVESLIFAGGFEPVRHLGFGARIPLTLGSFSPPNRESRGTTVLGNIEIEGEYEAELSEQVKLLLSLGLALPTAQGDEVPDSVDRVALDSAGRVDQNSYDRGALNRAAAAARGYEDNALFEPKRFGIIPKIALHYAAPGGLRIEPYIKLENLIDTTGNADDKYLGEIVGALRVAYLVQKEIEPGIRVWGNIPLNGPNTNPVGVVEPELRLHFGVATPYIGVIIPFAGPIAQDPTQFVAIRAGLAFRF
jgi:hypothetical protein